MQDEESILTLRYSAVISWTNLAEINYLLALGVDPHPGSRFRDQCVESLRHAIRLVEEMTPAELLTVEGLWAV